MSKLPLSFYSNRSRLRPSLEDISYSRDLISSDRLLLLSNEARCALYRLVHWTACSMVWTYSEPDPTGTLRNLDDKSASAFCGISTRKWRKVRPEIAPFFDIDAENNWRLREPWIIIAQPDDKRPHIPAALRAEILKRDGYRCGYCGDSAGPFHCDHVIPVSRGGATHSDNLICACAPCNLSKRNSTPEEWLATRVGGIA